MDRLTSMNVFVRAAELGSFAAAANDLRLSPQMVAKHIARLESRLGTALLNRTTRRQHLTDIGRSYYERCKIVLSEAEAADAIALEMKVTPSGTLRVNAPVTFGTSTLAPFITQYLAQYPETQVELTLSDRLVDPVEEGYEVILRIGELTDSQMIAYPLRPYRLIACASPGYLAQRGIPLTPAELAHHSCLVYGIWSPQAPCRWQFSQDGKTQEIQPEGRLRSNDWRALLHAAVSGYGVTLGPEDVLKEEITAGRLVQVLPDYDGPSRPMHVLTPAGLRQTVKIRSFIQALRDAFA
ncbi:LysR family transcriptional regulator [Rahnella victoriana]|uniref:LysR family transcriptional regulator n=1 Tax=Rahnella victoriana TaxID=1510570 RepID=UPI000BB196A2|nr:LysR family transcriptional regulator [Rahnella victoriana]PBI79077.1 LysR family transcriptional regulator [Rahnella victoriana]